MKTAYIIDHSNMVYRFKNAYKFATCNQNGITLDISALYGYIRALRANFFDDIYICLDGTPSRSLEVLPSYKGHRSNEPSEHLSVPRVELIKFLTRVGAFYNKNVRVIASPGQEADQVIASLVAILRGKAPDNRNFLTNLQYNFNLSLDSDWRLKELSDSVELSLVDGYYENVVIASTDSDMYQLIRYDGVFMDSSTIGRKLLPREYTPKAVKGLSPTAIAAYKMLFGDVSDNVPRIVLPFTDAQLMKMIKSSLDSEDKLYAFITSLKGGTSPADALLPLYKAITNTNQAQAVINNQEVTTLRYISSPLQLSFPTYSIEETIEHYSLRV